MVFRLCLTVMAIARSGPRVKNAERRDLKERGAGIEERVDRKNEVGNREARKIQFNHRVTEARSSIDKN